MTHDRQSAISNMEVRMNGDGSSAQIVSRSVAKGTSRQTFHPNAVGNALCKAHIQCDSIIMDDAQVCSIPEIDARHIDAQIIHEAAIGSIAKVLERTMAGRRDIHPSACHLHLSPAVNTLRVQRG